MGQFAAVRPSRLFGIEHGKKSAMNRHLGVLAGADAQITPKKEMTVIWPINP
jgi:hypothetical protein